VAPAPLDQDTCVVKSWVLLLLYTPVAYSWTDVPLAIDGVAGVVDPCVAVITIDARIGAEFTTVRLNGADTIPFNDAVILVVVELVGSNAVANPPLAIVAAAVLLEAQLAALVTSPVLPLL
jgi:hypothetical protein